MRNKIVSLITLFVLGLTSACSAAADSPSATPLPFEELEPKASALVEALIAGDYAAASADFDATMVAALPQDKLQQAWESLPTQLGAFQSREGSHNDVAEGYARVYETLQFEKARIDVQVVFNSDGNVTGLFFVPAK